MFILTPLGYLCFLHLMARSLLTGGKMAYSQNVVEEFLLRCRRCYFVLAIHLRPKNESPHYSHTKVAMILLSNISNTAFSHSFLWEIIKLEAKHVMNIKIYFRIMFFLLEERGD